MRTVAAGQVLALSTFLIGIATDEADASWTGRLARLSALLPALGAIAGALVLVQARSRGETRALSALGLPPWLIARGALSGGVLVGLFGAAMVAAGFADVGSLFPSVRPDTWEIVEGVFIERARGLSVHPSGDLERGATPGLPGLPIASEGARSLEGPTAWALLLASFAVPTWAMLPAFMGRRLAVALFAGSAAVTSFHLVGAGWITPWALLVAPSLLLLDSLTRGGGAPALGA